MKIVFLEGFQESLQNETCYEGFLDIDLGKIFENLGSSTMRMLHGKVASV